MTFLKLSLAPMLAALVLGGCSAAVPEDETSEGAVVASDAPDPDVILAGGGKFEITQKGGQFLWDLKAKNGRAVLHSVNLYGRESDAITSIHQTLRNLLVDSQVDQKTEPTANPEADQFTFHIRAKERVVATSHAYASKANRDRALENVRTLLAGDEATPLLFNFSELLVVRASKTSKTDFRLRLVDKDGKLLMASPESKAFTATEINDQVSFLEALSMSETGELPGDVSGLQHVQIEGEAANWHFSFNSFRRDAEGLLEPKVLLRSTKKYSSEAEATAGAKAAWRAVQGAPKG